MGKGMTKQKIVISVDTEGIRRAKTEATNYLVLLDRAKTVLKSLTNDNVSTLDINDIDSYFNGLTGFKNGQLSAMAYGLENQYNNLQNLINEVDEGKATLNYISKGKVDTKAIEEAHTTYLRDGYVDEYNKLKDAIEVLNETSTFVLKNSLKLDNNGLHLDVRSYQSCKLQG